MLGWFHAIQSIVLLAADQVLKLPAGKYTVREREMMTGSGVLPTEFFHVGSALGKTVLIGMLCAAITCFSRPLSFHQAGVLNELC